MNVEYSVLFPIIEQLLWYAKASLRTSLAFDAGVLAGMIHREGRRGRCRAAGGASQTEVGVYRRANTPRKSFQKFGAGERAIHKAFFTAAVTSSQ